MAPGASTSSNSFHLPMFNPTRLRSYILRLPLFTRIVLVLITVFWIAELQSAWNVVAWGGLKPSMVGFGTMYRLNTYPLIHLGFFHFLFNAFALVPLLERFEAEHGTLLTAAHLAGPLSTLPAGLYLLFEKVILRRDNTVAGASVWIFVFLGHEAVKAFKANPYFNIGTYKIPTWTSPLFLLVFISALVPNVSFLGHLCALSVGYIYGFGYLKILAPPEKILRWIEGKLNLLGRLPHYVSVDQKTYGRYGVLPTSAPSGGLSAGESFVGHGQRLGSP